MKVGLVCPYSLSVPGGVQQHVLDLASWLRRQGHDVDVLAPCDGPAPAGVTPAARSRAVPYNGSVARIAPGPGAAARTRTWLRAGHFDVLHVHEPLAPSVSLRALAATTAPAVVTFHSCAEAPRLVRAAAAYLGEAFDDAVVRLAVSTAAVQTVASVQGPVPRIVPNGVDVNAFGGAGERDGRTVAFLGRGDEPRKGLAVLARAMPLIMAAKPDVRLVIAGPADPTRVRRLFRSGEDVEFLGQVTERQKADLLRRADIFVAPQIRGESFGISLVEAMAAGCPVVASDLPAFRDVTQHGRSARLFPVGVAQALAAQVVQLLGSERDRAALSAAARERARAYDWSVVGEQILAAYAQAQGVSSGHRREVGPVSVRTAYRSYP